MSADDVERYEAKASTMLAPVLKGADASPNMRSVVQSLLGAQLQSKDKIEKLVTTLDHLAAIVERVPARLASLERRVRDLESRHGN